MFKHLPPYPGSTFPAPLSPERQPFFTVDPLCPLVVNHQAIPLHHDVQPGTAKPLPLRRQLPESLTQEVVNIRFRPVTVDRGRDIDQRTDSPFAQPKALPGTGDR